MKTLRQVAAGEVSPSEVLTEWQQWQEDHSAYRDWLLSLNTGDTVACGGARKVMSLYEVEIKEDHAAGYAVFFKAPFIGRVIFPNFLEANDIGWMDRVLTEAHDEHGHNWRQCPHCGELVRGHIVDFYRHTGGCNDQSHQE